MFTANIALSHGNCSLLLFTLVIKLLLYPQLLLPIFFIFQTVLLCMADSHIAVYQGVFIVLCMKMDHDQAIKSGYIAVKSVFHRVIMIAKHFFIRCADIDRIFVEKGFRFVPLLLVQQRQLRNIFFAKSNALFEPLRFGPIFIIK